MSDSFAYIDIILFAMVAAFIALRLRSVLGKRTGEERRRPSAVERRSPASPSDRVREVPGNADAPPREPSPIEAAAPGPLRAGLAEVRLADPGFEPNHFLEGAKAAFAMIIEAFAKGDRGALQPLLAPDVYSGFESVITEREAAGEMHVTQVVSVDQAEIVEAGMLGSDARVTVRFGSQQIVVVKNAQGEVIDGDATEVIEVSDVWTFSRDTRSGDPNWVLVETRGE